MSAPDVRLAPPLDSYPPLRYRGEDGRAVLRREPCRCGSEVVRLSGEDDQSAVARHNATPEHLAWRVNRESQDGGPTAAHGARDVSARLSERPAAVLRGRGHDPSIPRGGRP